MVSSTWQVCYSKQTLICLLINQAVAILGVPLVSIRIEILKPDKVGTFIIVVKCIFLKFTLKMVKGNKPL